MTQEKEISKKSKSNFYYAFNLLKKQKKQAMNVIYSFCRQTDDIVDQSTGTDNEKREKLKKWKNELENAFQNKSDNTHLKKVVTIAEKYKIQKELFFELIRGVEMDLNKKRYETIDELIDYCYCVASTVGLMSIEIFGYENESAKEFAKNLGIALQLTNIIRDVSFDADEDRIYLPQEYFKEFDYSINDLIRKTYNANFMSLMARMDQVARSYYGRADRSIFINDMKSLAPALAMRSIYLKVMNKIRRKKYRVFDRKITLSKFEKIYITIKLLLKYNLLY